MILKTGEVKEKRDKRVIGAEAFFGGLSGGLSGEECPSFVGCG